ncbi:MAG TPA: hypothetical protein VKY65_16120 [Alphaproteobacteria bacterium]|nr:hypothetical protein [Alphaproteobacteria bacterium]
MRPIILAAVLLSAPAAAAAELPVHHGFLTGKSYLQISDVVKPLYVSGLIDGLLGSPLFGAPAEGKVARLGACLEKMSSGQATAVVTRYVRAHPAQQDWDMQVLAYDALHDLCGF